MAFGSCAWADTGFSRDARHGRGLVVPPGDMAALTQALRRVAESPATRDSMRGAASAWAQRFSLEGLRDALRDLLAVQWRPAAPAWARGAAAELNPEVGP